MAGAEISNIKAAWVNGALQIQDLSGNAIITINPSTGGVAFTNGGGMTVSSGFTAYGGMTVSSGLTIDGIAGSTATAATNLSYPTHGGKVVKCTTDAIFFTLPLASTTTLQGGTFTIMNTASAGGAQIILITTTTESIIGAGISTSNLLANTKASAKPGDYVRVGATGSSTWYITGMVGTWASTT